MCQSVRQRDILLSEADINVATKIIFDDVKKYDFTR